ncbi:MAG: Rpn family recombination-promoting nuclease/putative transposase [Caldilinea sp. CFX5]|nr:Rpn family recombination-promoting nuclease/putative transposase [Caldilinea sp. CFX5]
MTGSKERTLVSFDWAMKHLLRDKANFDVLEGFLSALLGEEIQVIALLESEANQGAADDKFNRVDLLVQDSQGVNFIIEVQYSYASHYLKRLLYGAAKLITEHLEVGDEYSNVKKVISISLLYFLLGDSDEESDYVYHGATEFYGLHSGKALPVHQDTVKSDQQMVRSRRRSNRTSAAQRNIFPEYYLIEVERFPDVVKSALDEWIYFFKHSTILDEFRAKHIQTAREKLDLMKMSAADRQAYERFWLARASYQDEIQSARTEERRQTLQEVLPVMAQLRFGSALPGDLSERLQQCPLATLHQLQATIQTAPTSEEWLTGI